MLKNLRDFVSNSQIHTQRQTVAEVGLRRYLGRPDGAVAVTSPLHVRRHAGKMVDQAKVGRGQDPPSRFRADSQLGKWEDAGPSPFVDVLLGFGSILEIQFSRAP